MILVPWVQIQELLGRVPAGTTSEWFASPPKDALMPGPWKKPYPMPHSLVH